MKISLKDYAVIALILFAVVAVFTFCVTSQVETNPETQKQVIKKYPFGIGSKKKAA